MLNPPEKKTSHGTFMRYVVILTSGFLSFIFVVVLTTGANIWHLRDVFSGREKNNVPKNNDGTEKYRPKQPYPDMKKLKITRDVSYYAKQLGLELQEYDITTEDGYILPLHRLVDPSESEEDRNGKVPILLQHGLLSASGAWLAPGANSLPYYFVHQGFDVWLGNNRCEFKPRHATLKGNLMHNEEFWDWDIRVFAAYDLPCIIDNVLSRKPNHDKLYLVGHSQGCTQSVLLLRNPELAEYHKKIIHFFALAPAIFPGSLFHDRSFIKFIHNRSPTAYKLIFGRGVFIGFLGWARKNIGTTRLYSIISYQMFKYLFGWNIRNNYKDKKVQHIQFVMNVSYISAKLMSWWLSYSVEEGFSNQLQSKEAYADGSNYAFTPVSTNEADDEEKQIALSRTGTLDRTFTRTQEQQDIPVTDEKTFFPYKFEWFAFNKKPEDVTPISLFICGEDYLVDGRRLASHMTHYERRLYKEGKNLKVFDLPTYNHLDVIWAQDCIGSIGHEVTKQIKSNETPQELTETSSKAVEEKLVSSEQQTAEPTKISDESDEKTPMPNETEEQPVTDERV
ncbi:hypothetical protein FT663_03472 [Candidozyma haemuli var. vulneris]|uniref:Partial AB-hydrolase lipase domain-containing protein n=1 Tax=Candidozyma haemuli TaxID=45357 RepID=A0A2V1AU03_9ASCO|nr:hypothetical protein CXQ85_000541 [[Candida] haemuloni]KAF3988266.1 hypothetical protein FT662_03537 [[Candida] haemuloni var. vulneris]KAF3989811.1 hypothetical protein FT663_03472 [[Candida] haemuloni var. vulneris]PVH21560.1 hypothetical protein CXQ85_000541 [[Candida] haemuloni]